MISIIALIAFAHSSDSAQQGTIQSFANDNWSWLLEEDSSWTDTSQNSLYTSPSSNSLSQSASSVDLAQSGERTPTIDRIKSPTSNTASNVLDLKRTDAALDCFFEKVFFGECTQSQHIVTFQDQYPSFKIPYHPISIFSQRKLQSGDHVAFMIGWEKNVIEAKNIYLLSDWANLIKDPMLGFLGKFLVGAISKLENTPQISTFIPGVGVKHLKFVGDKAMRSRWKVMEKGDKVRFRLIQIRNEFLAADVTFERK